MNSITVCTCILVIAVVMRYMMLQLVRTFMCMVLVLLVSSYRCSM